MGNFPPRVDDWTLSDFDDAVTSVETRFGGCLNEIDMCPLILVIMDIVGNLAEKYTLVLKSTI